MNAEHDAKSASPKTGLFATLRAPLHLRGSAAASAGSAKSKGTTAPSHRRTAFALSALLCLSFAFFATTALAAPVINQFSTTFAGSGTNALSNPSDVAVDTSSHDVYVSDPANFRVEKFTPSGQFLFMIGKEVNKTAGETAGRESEENVCPAAGHPGDTCQPGTEGSSPGAFVGKFVAFDEGENEDRLFLAVDNSPGGEGDLYVLDPEVALVSKFDSSGNLVSSWGNNGPAETPNGQLKGSPGHTFAQQWGAIYGVAVKAAGDLDILTNGSIIEEFSQAGAFIGGIETPYGSVEPIGLTVNSAGNLFKSVFSHFVEEIAPTGAEIGQVNPNTERHPTGLAVNPAPALGDLYVDSEDFSTHEVVVEHFSFTATGEVNKEGGGTCKVESFGSFIGCNPTDHFTSNQLSQPAGVAVDAQRNTLYVANTGAGNVAVFTAPKHTLAVTVTGSGSVSASEGTISDCEVAAGTCSGEYIEGSSITLTATAAAGNQITWGAGQCTSNPTPTECVVAIEGSNKAVTATFAPKTHTVNVIVSGAGTVTANSGTISGCSESAGACSGHYAEGSSVTLAATPDPHNQVAWGAAACTSNPTPNECVFTIGATNKSVSVTFTPISHTLAVSKAGTGSGSITCNGTACASAYEEGTAITLAATAASGSTFSGWSGGGCTGAGTCTVMIEADTTVTATFAVAIVTPPPPTPTCDTDPSLCPPPQPKPLKCKKGFKKAKKHGKTVCVKVKKHHKKKQHHKRNH